MIEYTHKMGPGVQLLATPDGKAVVLIGGRFRVTDWLRG